MKIAFSSPIYLLLALPTVFGARNLRGAPQRRQLAFNSADFAFVGNGQCADSQGREFDVLEIHVSDYIPTAGMNTGEFDLTYNQQFDLASCADACAQRTPSSIQSEFAGLAHDTEECYCYFAYDTHPDAEPGDEAIGRISSIRTDTFSGPQADVSCYDYTLFVPTDTEAPSAAPTTAAPTTPECPYYHILNVEGGIGGNRYLSATHTGDRVDAFSHDDGSGRQRWLLEPISSGSTTYTIRIADGTPENRVLLSSDSHGLLIDLYSHDDGSGRQRWILHDIGNGRHKIQIAGGVGEEYTFLAIQPSDDASLRAENSYENQEWTIECGAV